MKNILGVELEMQRSFVEVVGDGANLDAVQVPGDVVLGPVEREVVGLLAEVDADVEGFGPGDGGRLRPLAVAMDVDVGVEHGALVDAVQLAGAVLEDVDLGPPGVGAVGLVVREPERGGDLAVHELGEDLEVAVELAVLAAHERGGEVAVARVLQARLGGLVLARPQLQPVVLHHHVVRAEERRLPPRPVLVERLPDVV